MMESGVGVMSSGGPPHVAKLAYASGQAKGGGEPVRDAMEGSLYKWTNYIKGYQKRWVVLKNGRLAYYRNEAEVGHSCRGTINLSGATVLGSEESATAFAVSHATQTFHLKAKDDADRRRWMAAIELAKIRAVRSADEEEAEEEEAAVEAEANSTEAQTPAAGLASRLSDLSTCQGLIEKHGGSLLRALGDTQSSNELLAERRTLFKITTSAMMKASTEFVEAAEGQAKRWERALLHERSQRQELEQQLVSLAKTHAALERATLKSLKAPAGGPLSDSEEDDSLYQDALEAPDELYNLTAQDRGRAVLKRSGSEMSATEEADEEARQRQKATDLLQARIMPSPQHSAASQRRQGEGGEGEADGSQLLPPQPRSSRQRRGSIPPKPNIGLSLWSVMKNSIGKDLSKIPMPVNFNEPLSMLQRLAEDLEYSYLLDEAAKFTDSAQQMAYVAAFTASAYGTLTNRTGKPFNPLLGETFESDRSGDFGWRLITEQVSHHPPAAAQHVHSAHGWELYQEFTMSSKFRGKYLSVIPLGVTHLHFKGSEHHYTWRKVTTTVHNIIVGKLWIDNHGEMTIENHKTGDKCHLKYIPYSYFSRDTPRKVTGVVTDGSGRAQWVVQGTWDESLEIAKVTDPVDASADSPAVLKTAPPRTVWRKAPPIPNCENMYHFTRLALELNEPEEGVAPTDSRRRPDQRLMEEGAWEGEDGANAEKLRLEEKQRAVRRTREAEAEQAMLKGQPFQEYSPRWFHKQRDPYTGNVIHLYNGRYWEAKEKQDWSQCPDIF